MNDKILIGKKGNVDRGYMFYPYIKVLEIKLPISFKEFDVEGKPIFIKKQQKPMNNEDFKNFTNEEILNLLVDVVNKMESNGNRYMK